MASTSTSSIQRSFKYDVFLSFRGEDTRKNFVDHLYHALKQKGINTYKDSEEIKKGKRISEELIRSVEDSRFYIIVFSKNYASSPWCLDELVKIMEYQKASGHTAYPVFYDVEPTEVRNQSGAVGESFAIHKEEEAAKEWRDALRQVAGLAGWDLKNSFDGHEAKFIKKIVEEISLELRFINPNLDGKLVAMKTRVKHVVTCLETDIDDVRMIGVKGMGGAGKTTLAQAVFDQISFQFEGSSFVKNVRESSEHSGWGLKLLQKQILSDVLNDQNLIVNGDSDFKKMLCAIKVLVVLDDVDHIDQLEALAGELSWFKPGSRIIITTRDEQVLVAHGVPKNLILDVNLFSYEEATCLFNKYAFGRVIPCEGYELLSDQVVSYAAGLPLTLKVLGSSLRGKNELVWKDALARLKTIPLKETLKILELSYESLEEEYKDIFLDVACLLKGWKEEEAIRALECRGFYARNGLSVLVQKSLISVSSGCLSMHDHIEEMGKNIVRRLHPKEPCRHSRLWNHDEIEDVLHKGSEATRCIIMQRVDPVILMNGLRNMKELKFLGVVDEYRQIYAKYHLYDSPYLPESLIYLRWDGYPFKYLPKEFLANNLGGLEMFFGNIKQLWEVGERKVLKKLRFIEMSCCKLRSLDIRLIPNLERLSLVKCRRLVEFHIPIKNSKLRYLNLKDSGLGTLDLELAQNLETLKVEDDSCLAELRMPVESLNLKHLALHCMMLKTINITQYQNLETLVLKCSDLVELHMPFKSPGLKVIEVCCYKLTNLNLTESLNLEWLFLEQCEDLVELQMPSESPKLKTVIISRSKMKTLNLTGSRNLSWLKLEQCEGFLEFHMPTEIPKLKRITISRSKMKTLNLTGHQNLELLEVEQCEDLVELHMPIGSPKLKTENIYLSKMITLSLTESQNLERLELEKCKDLVELRMPIERPQLKTINISCSKFRCLSLTWCRNLEKLELEQCEDLVELYMPIESPQLKTVNIHCSKIRSLNLTQSQNLEKLELEQCDDLVELHMPVKNLQLKSIKIRCSKLRTINLGLSLYLESLDLQDCFTLEEFNAPVGFSRGRVMFKPFVVNRGFPMVGSLSELYLTVRSLGICPLHPDNNLPKYHLECIYKDHLHSFSGDLKKLINSFGVCACTNLESLATSICGLHRLRKLTLEGAIPVVPKEIGQLECLEKLALLSLKNEHLPDNICMLKHLKFFQLKSCWFLKQLPEDIGRLECLEELYLTDCRSLRYIPNSICEMKCLKYFHVTDCILVEKLPKEIGRLKCLEELSIQGTSISDIPESIFQSEVLRFIL